MSYETKPWEKSIHYVSPKTGKETTLYSIGVLAEALGRTPQTIRKWEIGGIIPMTPFKKGNKRFYSSEHIDVIVRCAERAKIKVGTNINNTTFVKRVYEEFQAVNEMFFGKGE